jgi:hypothetical protein
VISGVAIVLMPASLVSVSAFTAARSPRRPVRLVGAAIVGLLCGTIAYGIVFAGMWTLNIVVLLSAAVAWYRGQQRHQSQSAGADVMMRR